MARYTVVAWSIRKVHSEYTVDAPNKREAARMVRESADGVGLIEDLDSFDHGPLHVVGVVSDYEAADA